MDIVSTQPSPLRIECPVLVRQLSDKVGDRAQVVVCPNLGYKTLWVDAADKKYRDHYLQFLQQEHGLNLKAIPKPFDVDHLFNATRATKYSYRFVRTALVDSPVNRSHGPGYEKTSTQGNRDRYPGSAQMDEIISMKFYNFMNPNMDEPRVAEIDAYVRFASAEFGFSEKDIRESIATCLRVARFFQEKAKATAGPAKK
jgi:hypothetical protein